MERNLVLFDIDHTLVDLLQFHEPAYRLVLSEVYGVQGDLRTIQFSGKTTPNIFRELGGRAGLEPLVIETNLPRALTRFSEIVLKCLDVDLRPHILPGVVELLQCLSKQQCVLGIVTGNPREIGMAVLQRTGLEEYFAACAFGTEAKDRVDLVALAIRRARKRCDYDFIPTEVTVVGDSPHDVVSGKRIGARTVALATGLSPRAELLATGPDFVFDNCADYQLICRAIMDSKVTE